MLRNTEDSNFFEKLYYKTCYDVRRFLRSRCDGYQDIEDVMQETYYEILMHLDMVKNSNNPEGYVMNVAKYKYMKYRTEQRKREENSEPENIYYEPVFEKDFFETVEVWDYVRRSLNYKDYLMVRLRYDNRDSIKIIAEKLNMTEAACKMRLKRSLQKLQKRQR